MVSDSCVAHFQKNLKKSVKLSYTELTFGMNVYLFIFTLIISITNYEIVPMTQFLLTYPECFIDIVFNNVFRISGLFILFYHLHVFGPVSVAYITTFRKIITISLSIVLFNHPMNTLHTIGLIIVLIVILVDFKRSYDKKQK